ncbi:MAG TPA: peptide chain release factor N(5)-glutamine methyltransferase [Burkholderiales bacterium]|nr:peptide chain release factor N(5)-glutamine methyltransferase [Burkholderiales bacterium]
MSARTIGEALQEASQRVAALDAQVLLRHVTGRDAAYLIAHPEVELGSGEPERYRALIDRRAAGEPVAYLTGEREFYGRPFKVTPAVLIPRPETELLVDLALERIPQSGTSRVLELGTGSGCIAISLAAERPNAKVLALDNSVDALAVARRNAVEAHVGNVAFLRSDWFTALRQEHFDLIVSNPPYVAAGDAHLTQGDLRFEPRVALEAGSDGLDAIRRIVTEGKGHLMPGGWLVFEHAHDHGERARLLLHAAGYVEIFTAHDLAGIDRVSAGRLTQELRVQ